MRQEPLRREYRSKLISPDAAISKIPDSATVEVSRDQEPQLLLAALAQRRAAAPAKELSDAASARGWGTLRYKALHDARPGARSLDVFLVAISPPDENGYCSFGCSLTTKHEMISLAHTVIAEILDTPRTRVRVFGESLVHVSEIDWFVENHNTDLKSRIPGHWEEPDDEVRAIAGNVKDLVRDGDTLEVGTGATTESLIRLGTFAERNDLGIHAGRLVPGMIDLVRDGIATGKRKTINRGKAVFSALSDEPEENLQFVSANPLFEMRQEIYVNDPRVVGAHDNFVAINGVLSVDLLGQATSESAGARVVANSGGLPGFVLGATFSNGGRNIMALRSTAARGSVSRIVPKFSEGARVTIPHTFADIVVTEFGVADLLGKSFPERAASLIEICHPAFRDSLRDAVATLDWAH